MRPRPAAAVIRPDDVRDSLRPMEEKFQTRVCLVGGYVRDLLMGREAKSDLDVVIEGTEAESAARWLCTHLGRRATVVSFERFGTAQVSFRREGDQPLSVEFVRARSEAYSPESRKPTVRPGTLEEDVFRRDFTVNALLLDSSGHVLDPTGRGLDDLFSRVLRTPLDPELTFSEDPLRMMRAARFAAQLGFEVADGLVEAMTAAAPRLAIISAERIRDELVKLLCASHPAQGLLILLRTGLLSQFAPELAAMSGVEQRGYHLGDVFEHTQLALEAAAPERLVRLAVLFHDIGKPPTAAQGPDGPTFYGHPKEGASITRRIMERLRFSQAETDAVARLVELHMRPIPYRSDWTDSAVRRLWHDSGPLAAALLQLARADTLGSAYPGTEELDQLELRMRQLAEVHPAGLRPPLDGNQLMETMGLPPGPWIGRATRLLTEAMLEGELPSGEGEPGPERALSFLEEHRESFWPRAGEPGHSP